MHLFDFHVEDYFLRKVDARVKIITTILCLSMVLSYKGFTLPIFVASLCLIACIKMRVQVRLFALRFLEPLFIAGLIVTIKFLFTGKDPLFSLDLFGLTIIGYRDGLIDGFMIASRIIAAVSIITTVTFTTPFTEIMAALSWFKIPKGFIEILMFAYRYIFVLIEEALIIYSAQKNRLGYLTIRHGLKSFGILVGSLIIKAFEHSQTITLSMVQRGYDGNIPIFKNKPFKASEIFASAVFLSVVGWLWTI